MMKIPAEQNYSFAAKAVRKLVRGVSRELSFIALDFVGVTKSATESSGKKKTHVLPDVNIIGWQRGFACQQVHRLRGEP